MADQTNLLLLIKTHFHLPSHLQPSRFQSLRPMNATTGPTAGDGGGFLGGSQNIGGFGYGIGVSIGILLLITTITLASYFCTRGSHNQHSSTSVAAASDHHHRHVVVEIAEEDNKGIDEATLKSYPKVVYSEAKKRQKIIDAPTAASCCSICLADYRNADVLRLLPDCGHLFHVKCVDPWLRKHPTCPMCRTSPLPSPLSTPLAEVVPLATRPRG